MNRLYNFHFACIHNDSFHHPRFYAPNLHTFHGHHHLCNDNDNPDNVDRHYSPTYTDEKRKKESWKFPSLSCCRTSIITHLGFFATITFTFQVLFYGYHFETAKFRFHFLITITIDLEINDFGFGRLTRHPLGTATATTTFYACATWKVIIFGINWRQIHNGIFGYTVCCLGSYNSG